MPWPLQRRDLLALAAARDAHLRLPTPRLAIIADGAGGDIKGGDALGDALAVVGGRAGDPDGAPS